MPNRVRQFSGRLWRWLVERLWQRPAGWIVESDRNAPVRLRFLAHLAAVLLLALVVAVVSALVLWWTLGRPRLAPESPGPLTPTDLYDGVKIALAVVGGIGGLVALVVAYRKQRFAEREHVRAEAAVVREDTKLFTERFGKASEQLGSDKAAVRLAGVYAMASLADDWAEGRQMCIDVLCAYLRMPYTPPAVTATRRDGAGIADIHDLIYFVNERRAHATGHSASNRDANVDRAGFQGGNGGATGTDPGMSVDDEIQWSRLQEQNVRSAIIEVIAQHLRDDAKVSWQGYNFNFRGAVLDGIDFSGVVFRAGKLDFFGAKFTRESAS